MPRGNTVVAEALATLFASTANSDCTIQFVLESESARPSKRARLEVDPGTASVLKPGDALGDPLPGHTIVLRYASEWFRAKLDDLTAKQQELSTQLSNAKEAGSAAPLHDTLLRVPLGSNDEVTSARAAIQYGYTGDVQAGSVRQALEVMRQAGYLQIKGCAAACLGLIKEELARPHSATSSEGPSPEAPAVLELYACEHMWPALDEEPSFASVLAVAKPLLVSHFGDTLAALNRPNLWRQLLSLPAAGVEALLESDEFGTDTEDSVLLLLATWMRENRGGTDAATRERLCRLVRLAQLSRTYAIAVLHALAADTARTHSDSGPGWFPITLKKASFFTCYASATKELERKRLLEMAEECNDPGMAWYNTKPRRQCLPASGGLAFPWFVRKEDLEAELKDAQACDGGDVKVYVTFADEPQAYARGLVWDPSIAHDRGKPEAGVFISCCLPDAYKVEGSYFAEEVVGMAQIDARLEVYSWREGSRTSRLVEFNLDDFHSIDGSSWGELDALPLLPQPAGGGGGLLRPWAEYIRDGKIEGTLTVLRPT